MLSPEVLNFDPPRAMFQFERVQRDSISREVTAGKLCRQIFKSVTIVAPGVEHLPDAVISVLKDRRVYRVEQVPMHAFLEDGFLNHFVRKGEIVGSSLCTWTDFENAAKLENGILKLSVTKEAYEELGLTGQPKLIVNRVASLYEICVNLADPGFTPSSKRYQRVLWCLKDRLNLTFDWFISWSPNDVEVCPSSLAAYWDYHGLSVKEHRENVQQSCLKELSVPEVSDGCRDSAPAPLYDLLEWVGATALEIRCPTEETYESSLTVTEPCTTVAETSVVNCNGIFSRLDVSLLLDRLFALFEGERESVRWVNVTVHDLDNGLVSFFLTPESVFVCRLHRPANKLK